MANQDALPAHGVCWRQNPAAVYLQYLEQLHRKLDEMALGTERSERRSGIREGHETVVQLLLEHGADVEAKDGYDWTPLLLAAQKGHEAVVRLLLEKGANIEAKGRDGWSPYATATARTLHSSYFNTFVTGGSKGPDLS